jgi:two-component system LytT family response regulator
MIKAIIIDDEQGARNSLSKLLLNYCKDVEIKGMASSVSSGLTLIYDHSPDVVFLDISLPDGNGFDIFEQIPSPSFDTIFITAYEEYAVKAFRVAALDFLTKPIDYRQLQEALKRFKQKQKMRLKEERLRLLIENLSNRPSEFNKIVLPDYDGYQLLKVGDIIYCEADGSYTHIHLINGKKVTTSRILKLVEQMLPETTFHRIHKSYLVNLNLIERYSRIEGNKIILANHTELDVSDRNKKAFLERLQPNRRS